MSLPKICLANYQAGQFKFPGLISKERGLEKKLTVIEGDEKQMFMNLSLDCCDGGQKIEELQRNYSLIPG